MARSMRCSHKLLTRASNCSIVGEIKRMDAATSTIVDAFDRHRRLSKAGHETAVVISHTDN